MSSFHLFLRHWTNRLGVTKTRIPVTREKDRYRVMLGESITRLRGAYTAACQPGLTSNSH